MIHVRQQWTKYDEIAPVKTKKGRRRVPLAAEDVLFLKALKAKALQRGLASPESVASYAAHRGVPLSHLSEVIGHSNIGSPRKVYVHLHGREQAEDAFPAAMSGTRRASARILVKRWSPASAGLRRSWSVSATSLRVLVTVSLTVRLWRDAGDAQNA